MCLAATGGRHAQNSLYPGIALQLGRKITHHSSRLGLIGWTGSIQIIKTIHHKMCNTNNVQLPHELLHGHNVCTKQSRISVPNRLQGRALKHKVALFICWAQRFAGHDEKQLPHLTRH